MLGVLWTSLTLKFHYNTKTHSKYNNFKASSPPSALALLPLISLIPLVSKAIQDNVG